MIRISYHRLRDWFNVCIFCCLHTIHYMLVLECRILTGVCTEMKELILVTLLKPIFQFAHFVLSTVLNQQQIEIVNHRYYTSVAKSDAPFAAVVRNQRTTLPFQAFVLHCSSSIAN